MPTISGNQEQGSIGLPGSELGNDRGCKERQHPVQHDEKQGTVSRHGQGGSL